MRIFQPQHLQEEPAYHFGNKLSVMTQIGSDPIVSGTIRKR